MPDLNLDFEDLYNPSENDSNSSGFGFEKNSNNNEEREIDTLNLDSDSSFLFKSESVIKQEDERVEQLEPDMFRKFSSGISPEMTIMDEEPELDLEENNNESKYSTYTDLANDPLESMLESETEIGSNDEEYESDELVSESLLSKFSLIKKYKNIIIGLIIVIVVIKFISLIGNKLSSNKEKAGDNSKVVTTTQEVKEASRDVNTPMDTKAIVESEYALENVNIDKTIYSSYIFPEKYIKSINDSIIPMLKGTTVDKVTVAFPISIEDYNSIQVGQAYKIYYNKVKINNEIYLVNLSLGGILSNETSSNKDEESR